MKYSMIKYNMRYGIVQSPVVTTRLLLKLELNRELMLLPLNLFFVWFFNAYFPTEIFASFSWYKEIFFPRKYWPNALCFFTRICLHWVPVFKKIFSKKTFPSYSLFSENISQENILTSLPFSEIIFPRYYYPPPPRLLPPAPPLLLLLRPLLPCWFLIISLTYINFLIRRSTSN